jgi:heterodisulfide reductase subunit B
MGIDWRAAWAEFERDADKLRRGDQQFLTWEDVDA